MVRKRAWGAWGFMLPVALGLALTEVLAAVEVGQSNRDLAAQVSALLKAGYVSVPNAHVLPALKAWGPMVWGGLFFALTLGAGLSLAALAAAWGWRRGLGGRRVWLIPLALPWLALAAAIQMSAGRPWITACFLLVPLIVFLTASRTLAYPNAGRGRTQGAAFFLPLILLAALLATQADSGFFLRFRDRLLLSNPVGLALNDFYYRYTLYAAEVIKPLGQKSMRTVDLSGVTDPALRQRLAVILARYDYLNLTGDPRPDLRVRRQGDGFLLIHGQTQMREAGRELFQHTGQVLDAFSDKTDGLGLSRQTISLSLMLGLPLLLYGTVFALLRLAAGLFLAPSRAAIAAGTIALLIGLAGLLPLLLAPSPIPNASQVGKALASSNPSERLAALHFLEARHIEIAGLPQYRRLLDSPWPAERYWLARCLGWSRRPGPLADLKKMLDDPNLNVVCMAYYGLGLQRRPGVAEEILARFPNLKDWYVQTYAYQALRSQGWVQNVSR